MPIRSVFRPRVEVVKQITALQCNVCGEEESLQENGMLPYDMHIIQLSGGWGDTCPGDMETLTIVVHGRCLEAWTKSFKVPVTSSNSFLGSEMEVIHSESHIPMVIEGHFARPGNEPYSSVRLPESFEDDQERPELGVYQHFKGQYYELMGFCYETAFPHTPLAIYRALYGESEAFVRPLEMWSEIITRGSYRGPRFKKV